MNKKELRHAFNTVLRVADNTKCEQMHHPEKWRHKDGYVCPAEYNLGRQIQIIREYMARNGI